MIAHIVAQLASCRFDQAFRQRRNSGSPHHGTMSAARIAVPGYDTGRIAKISFPSLRQVRALLPSEWITGGSSLLHYPLNLTSAHDGSGFAV
jgi:hypothetical protein